MDTGLLVARLVLGSAMAAHGAQKLFGWWGGYGLQGTGGYLEAQGYRPGRAFALLLALAEIASGALTALGLLGPAGPALMIQLMLVAAVVGHGKNGFFAATGGVELPVLYAIGALALLSAGPGALSLDHVLGLQALSSPSTGAIALALAIASGVGTLAIRRPAPKPAAASKAA